MYVALIMFNVRWQVVLCFENTEDEDPTDVESSDSDAEEGPWIDAARKQLLLLWNGLYFHKESLTLPWMTKAKRDAKTNLVKEAFEKVKGVAFVAGEVEPETNKTHLNKGSMYTELSEMKSAANKRVKDHLAVEYLEQVTKWSEEDNNVLAPHPVPLSCTCVRLMRIR